MNNLKKGFIVVLLTAMVLAVGSCSLFAANSASPSESSATAQQDTAAALKVGTTSDGQARTVSVTGSGSAMAVPDEATVQLGVDTKSDSASVAANDNTVKMTQVMAAIKKLGIADEDIQTINYSIYVEHIYQDGKLTNETVYHVANQVSVKVRDLSLVGPLLEAAIAADANNVGGVTFGFSDSVALERNARDLAMQDAKNKAQQLANGLGVTLGAAQQISEYGGSPVRTEAVMAKSMESAAPISGGQLEVNIQVSVSFGIE